MAAPRHTLHVAAHHLALAAAPLIVAGQSLGDFRRLMARLGFTADMAPAAFQTLATAADRTLKTVEAFPDSPSLPDVLKLVVDVKGLFDAVYGLTSAPAPSGIDPAAYAAEIGDRLVQLLVTDYLARNGATLSGLLQALDVLRVEVIPESGSRPSYARIAMRWSEIPKVLSEPSTLAQRAFKWGAADFDFTGVIEAIGDFFLGLHFPVEFEREGPEDLNAYLTAPDEEDPPALRRLKLPFFRAEIAGAPIEASVSLRALPAEAASLPGLALELNFPTQLSGEMQLHPRVKMRLLAGTNAQGPLGLAMRPDGVRLVFPQTTGPAPVSGRLGVGFDFGAATPTVLLGNPEGARLEFGSASVDLGLHIGGADVSPTLGADFHNLNVVLMGADADGFIASLLGGGASKIALPLGLEWSKDGPRFKGSAAFEVGAAPHVSIGPVRVSSLTLRLAGESDPEPKGVVEIGAGLSGSFGPLTFLVEGVGIRANIYFRSGNLGPIDVGIGFKPPTGAGLSVDAGVVKGGGYLNYDPVRKEYAGALELSIAGVVTVKAITLITTLMPDGGKGFSLLAIITAEFGTGIQIGFGFTILGVGGLLGLNRTMRLDFLGGALRTGAMDSILFPQDVVANAPRIISDLRQAFPPAPDRFLIGPMFKLGWGTPTLVSVSIGLLIEIPGNVAVVGALKIVMPADEAPLVVIKAAFVGTIEFDKQRAWFYAALYESRFLFATIDGAMGMVVEYGDDPQFLISVGGFHPSFEPPALPFPSPDRIAFSLVDEDIARLRVEAYQAVTSNTVQFGARAEFFFGLDSFSIDGHTSFDALIRFSPFYFIAEGSSSVSVRAFGIGVFSIRLQYTLDGPSPYRARGRGSISLLFFDLSADFDITFGEARDTLLPTIEALPLLEAEIVRVENWRAVPASGSRALVTLRKLPDGAADAALHPLGLLRVSQRSMPLDGKLDRIGAQTISDANRFSLDVVSPGLRKSADAEEHFALAQFETLSDAEKLSRPSYQRRPGGADFAPDGPRFDSGPVTQRSARYEESTIDTYYTTQRRRFQAPLHAVFVHGLKGNSVSLSPLSAARERAREPFAEKVRAAPLEYAVASTGNNTLHAAGARFSSEAAAHAYAAAAMTADPELEGSLHVVPAFALSGGP